MGRHRHSPVPNDRARSLTNEFSLKQISMKSEMEVAMKLLEKDIHEKQDTIISLRRQLDEIKLINLEMYKKLQVMCYTPSHRLIVTRRVLTISKFSFPLNDHCRNQFSSLIMGHWRRIFHEGSIAGRILVAVTICF